MDEDHQDNDRDRDGDNNYHDIRDDYDEHDDQDEHNDDPDIHADDQVTVVLPHSWGRAACQPGRRVVTR